VGGKTTATGAITMTEYDIKNDKKALGLIAAFVAFLKTHKVAEPKQKEEYLTFTLGLEGGVTKHVLNVCKKLLSNEKGIPEFSYKPPTFDSEKINTDFSELVRHLNACFDVSAYNDSDVKGKRFLKANTKTKKDGTKEAGKELTGEQVLDILINRAKRVAGEEDKS
tara:strand:+ start:2329 stop:2826 length:498 start_codon:yes stop_codon:yes gene_type:complete